MEWHVDHHTGDTIDKIEKGTSALYDFSEGTFEIIYAIVRLIGSFIMLAYFSMMAAGVALVVMMINVLITMRFDQVLVEQYRDLSRAENIVAKSANDAISNIRTVITLRVERLVFKAIMNKVEKPYPLFKRSNYLNEWKWCSTSQFCKIMIVVSLYVYFTQHSNTAAGILVSSVFLLVNYLDKLGDLFFRFAYMYNNVIRRSAKVGNAEELSKDFIACTFTNHVLPPNWDTLSIENLNFSYSQKEETIHLNDINVTMRKGEVIALIGPSAAGKSTLLHMIRSLYKPHSLTLRVDGKDIEHGFEGICQAISLVPQDPEIFATTIRENITMGAEHSDEMITHFTDMACITKEMRDLPKGLESSISEKGVNLSGGQKQRLGLARGLLASHDKDIVLLDEPTSSLDPKNSMEIYNNILTAFSGKTIISTVHQMQLLPLFDRIIVLDNGQVAAQGTIKELLSDCPEFRVLWEESHLQQKEKEVAEYITIN